MSLLKSSGYNRIITTRHKRIRALIIDEFLITFLISSTYFAIVAPDLIDSDNLNHDGVLLTLQISGLLLFFAKDTFNGISPGKWIEGIMVRDVNSPSNPPTLAKLVLRNVLLIIWPVELILFFWSDKGERLGDKIAKTVVVDFQVAPKRRLRSIVVISFIVVSTSFTFLFFIGVIKNSAGYKAAIREIERNEGIVRETGGINGYGFMPTVSAGPHKVDLEIKVIGNDKNVFVKVIVVKAADKTWELVELTKLKD